MEIRLQHYYHSLLIQFKIDLIVWKFISTIFPNAVMSWFKIDLIVWKSSEYLRAGRNVNALK